MARVNEVFQGRHMEEFESGVLGKDVISGKTVGWRVNLTMKEDVHK